MRSKRVGNLTAGVKGQARRNGINGMREGLRVYAGNSLPDLSGTRQQASRLLPLHFLIVNKNDEVMQTVRSTEDYGTFSEGYCSYAYNPADFTLEKEMIGIGM